MFKKIISLFMVIVILLTLSCCANPKDKDSNTSKGSKEKVQKSPYEQLANYLTKEGANYQGNYTIIRLIDEGSASISCDSSGNITFYLSYGYENQETSVTMALYPESITQNFTFKYELSGYTCTANGFIYSNLFDLDNPEVFGLEYYDNFPSHLNSKIDDLVQAITPSSVALMLANIQVMLLENVDMSLTDFGFSTF